MRRDTGEILSFNFPARRRERTLDGETASELASRRARRRERLEAWSDYIGFTVNKVGGLFGAVAGAADLINPHLIPTLHHPEYALGAGAALLGGKSMILLIHKITEALN